MSKKLDKEAKALKHTKLPSGKLKVVPAGKPLAEGEISLEGRCAHLKHVSGCPCCGRVIRGNAAGKHAKVHQPREPKEQTADGDK